MTRQIVIDTNVFISALRSRRGASHKLLSLIGGRGFDINVSVPLLLEYEAVAKRLVAELLLSEEDIDDILDYICSIANRCKVFYLWRPILKDSNDDMVLELAVVSNSNFIVTYNKSDFKGAKSFGLEVVTPKEFLKTIGGLP